ncbi:MAG TPA: hypothetical protein VKR32_10395, partial [Puia sp.]|nr:hypothetical protein [Puia sp.]
FEFDHVFVGRYDGTVRPDDHEVSAWVFIKPEELEQKMLDAPEQFTQWFHVAYPKVREWKSRQPD